MGNRAAILTALALMNERPETPRVLYANSSDRRACSPGTSQDSLMNTQINGLPFQMALSSPTGTG